MLDLLPDLTGQPAWVVVVVVALMVAGMIGTKWVARNAREVDGEEEEEPDGDRPALPSGGFHSSGGGDANTTLAITKALDLLANEAVESQGARAEVDRLREELLACSRERDRIAGERDRAQAELDQCNRQCRELAMRALERRGDTGD